MITINDIIEKLNKEQLRFAFDGDAIIEVYLGILIVSMYIEFDPDNSNRPIIIQYNLVPKDEPDFDIHHEVYDNYDGNEYQDLDLDTVIDGLRGIIEYSVPINKALTRIAGHINEIANEIEEYEIPENVVAQMFASKIDFY
jgi:hypothetical protein